MVEAFEGFVRTGDWGLVDSARKMGYKKAGEYAERLLQTYRSIEDKTKISEYIEKEMPSCLK